MISLKFFNKKKIFITGHTGFKGSWLTLALLEMGAKVAGYSLKPKKDSNFKILKLEKYIETTYDDIQNQKLLNEKIKKFKPSIIFHLAAQPLVRYSYRNPIETYKTNIIGTMNVLEIIRKSKFIRSAVIITSDKCYLNKEWKYPYRENDELGGIDPYSSSKACCELTYSTYENSYFKYIKNLGVATARAGNVIGGGDFSEDRIIPDCFRALKNSKNFIIRSPKSTRPWQHVLEPIGGYLLLAQKLFKEPKKYSGSWNFGPQPSERKDVKQLVKTFFKNINLKRKSKIIFKEDNNKKTKESSELQLSCDKSNKYLNWKPKWNYEQTIKYTAEWYYTYILKKKKIIEISKKQIKNYFYI